MAIRTDFIYPPIPDRRFDWCAVDDDTYDGAPDSGTRHEIGYGATEQEAIDDLKRVVNENYCARYCHLERREGEDCALNGGCPLETK